MIDIAQLTATVEEWLKTQPTLYLVDITASPDNDIEVTLDSDGTGVDIEQCLALTRNIEQHFDRDHEDYSLEVGSAGITSPLKVLQQYQKNIGNPVEVLTTDGRKLHGTLVAVDPAFEHCTVTVARRVKEEGWKRPRTIEEPQQINIPDIKSITYDLKF